MDHVEKSLLLPVYTTYLPKKLICGGHYKFVRELGPQWLILARHSRMATEIHAFIHKQRAKQQMSLDYDAFYPTPTQLD